MAKIVRKVAKIFGINAGVNQIGKFGSFADGSPVFTTDPTVIQALSNYLEGWYAAVIGANSPAIQDMNALCYLFAYQIAYLMQAGVAEWDATTTYYTGSLATSGGITYQSIQDTNLNHAVTDTAWWSTLQVNGLLTPNTLPADTTVTTGLTLTWPNLTIGSGKTLTVNTGANFEGVDILVVTGTMIVHGTARVA